MSVRIRPATVADAPAMLSIYRPYVEASVVSFEEDVPSIDEYTARVRKCIDGWACVVAESDSAVLGFCYGSMHRERAAYRWSVETTVYVDRSAHRSGIGRRLYEALVPALRGRGYCNAYAGVTLPNPASVGLHLAAGFQPIGSFPRVGYKFGQWHDVAWFHLPLAQEPGLERACSPPNS